MHNARHHQASESVCQEPPRALMVIGGDLGEWLC